MIGRLLAKLPAIPGGVLTKLAIYGLVYVLGMANGQLLENRRLVEKEHQASADRQRENHRQLLAWKAETETKLKSDYEQERRADQIAHELYQRTIRAATAAKSDAERRLAALSADNLKLTETTDGLRKVNEILAIEARASPPDPGCIMAPRVRDLLDTAIERVNRSSATGGDASGPAPIPVRPYTTPPLLTCRQLQRGILNVLEDYAELQARIVGGTAWEVEIAR